MTEYSKQEAAYRDKLISDIESIMKDLEHIINDDKPKLRVIKGEG